MERKLSLKILSHRFFVSAGVITLLFISSDLCARQSPHNTPLKQPGVSTHNSNPSPPLSLSENATPVPSFQNSRPHPLMHGDDFDYDLYYNYRLTPHIILRPNLQQTTKPGAVDDGNPQRFVGGLSAGIQF